MYNVQIFAQFAFPIEVRTQPRQSTFVIFRIVKCVEILKACHDPHFHLFDVDQLVLDVKSGFAACSSEKLTDYVGV